MSSLRRKRKNIPLALERIPWPHGSECEERNTDDPLALEKIPHGFEFKDRYNLSCRLQTSSLATEAAIWLGVCDPEFNVLAGLAHTVGIETKKTTGWVEYPLPKGVLCRTLMHLTQAQVKQLLPLLQQFAKTGEIDNDEEDRILIFPLS